MPEYARSEINRVRRAPERGQYDKETIYGIVDDALICHVAFTQDDQPFVIPTLHARRGDEILLHGATTSRLIRHIGFGHSICLAMTHVDGIVLARSIFHHSVNYRSAILFGKGYLVKGAAETMDALEKFSERLLPGRWADSRRPNQKELKATAVVAIPIETASAKIRSGPPRDEEEDYSLPYWAGVMPIQQAFGQLEPDGELAAGIEVPDYVHAHMEKKAR